MPLLLVLAILSQKSGFFFPFLRLFIFKGRCKFISLGYFEPLFLYDGLLFFHLFVDVAIEIDSPGVGVCVVGVEEGLAGD